MGDEYFLPIEIYEKLKSSGRVLIGADYYAQLSLSAPLFPANVRSLDYKRGQVYVFELYFYNNNEILWSQL